MQHDRHRTGKHGSQQRSGARHEWDGDDARTDGKDRHEHARLGIKTRRVHGIRNAEAERQIRLLQSRY